MKRMIRCIHCNNAMYAINEEGEIFKDGTFMDCTCGKHFPFQKSRIVNVAETSEERAEEIEPLVAKIID